MKIKQLKYENLERNWHLNQLSLDGLTLLVGASGVGKTQILNSILDLKLISEGEPVSGVKWAVVFSAVEGLEYAWEGEYEVVPWSREGILPVVLWERLVLNGKEIVRRENGEIYLRGKQTPKLASDASVVHSLKEEVDIAPVFRAFKKIQYQDQTRFDENVLRVSEHNPVRILDEFPNLESLRNSSESTAEKLYWTFHHAPAVYAEILEGFFEIFPFVEEVRFVAMEPKYNRAPLVHIKERGIADWIPDYYISSGMKRTLLHLAELHLAANGSLILIDEFENSLGVNCIGQLTSALLENDRDLQFIITSHHPFIINNIDFRYWKLVTRKGGQVTTREADDFGLGQSKHQAFMQLINLEAYRTGIE